MNEMKCPNCGKFLGIVDGEVQIKCPRCKQLHTYRSKSDSKSNSKPDADPEIDIDIEAEASKIH